MVVGDGQKDESFFSSWCGKSVNVFLNQNICGHTGEARVPASGILGSWEYSPFLKGRSHSVLVEFSSLIPSFHLEVLLLVIVFEESEVIINN